MSNAYLIAGPRRVHRHWWTVLPALPTGPDTVEAHILRRVWFDHTMNTFRKAPDGALQPGPRGFHIDGTEDQMTPVLFQSWAALGSPDRWLPGLLGLFGVRAVGQVRRARWAYLFEQGHGARRANADIVLSWEDDAGEAVLVIEAKRRGGKPTAKDFEVPSRYLAMPSIAPFSRRYLGFIVDDADAARIAEALPAGTALTTWQSMMALQLRAVEALELSPALRALVRATVGWVAARQGVATTTDLPCAVLPPATGTADAYEALRRLGCEPLLTAFLLGAEAARAADAGRTPEAPMAWLEDSPDFLTISQEMRQTTPERQVPRWRLDWKPAASPPA